MNNWAMAERAARHRNNLSDDYEMCAAEVLPYAAPRGVPVVYHIHIGIPRVLERGKNKGRKRWDGERLEDWIPESEVVDAGKRYEDETGNCNNCLGEGKTVASGGIDGTTYRECGRCHGTGKAP